MLTFNELRAANAKRQDQWESGIEFSLIYLGNALAGETGEACNVIKKLERHKLGAVGSKATPEMLAEELADVIIYADLIARKIGVDLGEAVRDKFNASSDKLGFDVKL